MLKMNNVSMTILSEKSREVAQALIEEQVDPNEVAHVVTALNSWLDSTELLFFLTTIRKNGNSVVRSNLTLQYYAGIHDVCRKHLSKYFDKHDELTNILGWAVRLMRFYRVEDKLEQPPLRKTQLQPTQTSQGSGGERLTGQIESFFYDRGFGFILTDNGNTKHFFHHSQLPKDWRNPQTGQRVSFIIGQGPNGRSQAQQLRQE